MKGEFEAREARLATKGFDVKRQAWRLQGKMVCRHRVFFPLVADALAWNLIQRASARGRYRRPPEKHRYSQVRASSFRRLGVLRAELRREGHWQRSLQLSVFVLASWAWVLILSIAWISIMLHLCAYVFLTRSLDIFPLICCFLLFFDIGASAHCLHTLWILPLMWLVLLSSAWSQPVFYKYCDACVPGSLGSSMSMVRLTCLLCLKVFSTREPTRIGTVFLFFCRYCIVLAVARRSKLTPTWTQSLAVCVLAWFAANPRNYT